MAHFAEISGSNNTVVRVIVSEQDFINSGKVGDSFNWVQTSYNTSCGVHTKGGTPFRKNYAGVGMTYDEDRDAFIPPKPFDSWTLNEDTCQYDSPVAYPDDIEKIYHWNEDNGAWEEVE